MGKMKKKPDIIVMLSQNDITVKDAHNIFMSSWDLDVQNWGFKNTGIDKEDIYKLVKTMKEKGKKTFLEVLTYDEISCLDIAKTAAECEFDEVMGTLYFPSVHKYLIDNKISYKPFIGKVSGIPSILESTYAEILDDAKKLLEKGIAGFDFLAYRSKEDGETLTRQFCKAIDAEICVAGSISSFNHIDVMLDIAPSAFTIGSALFDKRFASNGTFRENLQAVINYIKTK